VVSQIDGQDQEIKVFFIYWPLKIINESVWQVSLDLTFLF
jgi:hypothetical protein